ncbi:MAG: efflux RND transporter periplasmic adaptor subunit [Candidatus Omnitrophica bacterium]|nr:efflux RND transporter periplasmic adaptor subunit [Candidatus Omnitrophota bacterium]
MVRQKRFYILILAALSIFYVSGCGGREETGEKKIIPVKVVEIALQDIKDTLDYAGDIKAQDEAKVYPKVSGKIMEKLKEDGSEVKKDDIIAYIDRDEIGFKFENAPVESPMDGIVGRVYVDKGMSVSPGTPVALVVDIDKVKVELDVPEKYLPKIGLEQTAMISVDAYPGREFMGSVKKISPVIDLETRTAPIEILIDNEKHHLKPGMFARVRLIIEEHKEVPVILKESIIGQNAKSHVYVIENDKARKRDIKLGIRQGAYFEVTEGLEKGELIVIMGQQKLYDGAPVVVEKEESGT